MQDRFQAEPEYDAPKSKINKRIIIIVVVVILVVLLLIGVGLVIYFVVVPEIKDLTSSDKCRTKIEESTIEEKDSRIDCLPWLRNDRQTDIKAECSKLAYCKYQDVDCNRNTPSCFVNKELTRVEIDVNNKQNTSLGESYTLTYNSFSNNQREKKTIRIDFEYLDANVLRFRLYDPNKSEYEVPLEVTRPKTRAVSTNYYVEIDRSNFRIVRSSTKVNMYYL